MLRIFLISNALLWTPYGLYCFFDPAFLADAAGVAATSSTGTVELQAMYGGLQVGLGLLAGMALLNATLERPALLALAFVTGGLFTARLLGAIVAMDVSSYTAMALLFEILLVTFATRLLPQAVA